MMGKRGGRHVVNVVEEGRRAGRCRAAVGVVVGGVEEWIHSVLRGRKWASGRKGNRAHLTPQ